MENVCKGRQGTILMPPNEWWLVRSTTRYVRPAFTMTEKHMKQAIYAIDSSYVFNNVLVEVYDDNYTKMGFHTDQMQDIEENSNICIYSNYACGFTPTSPRLLVVKNKNTKEEQTLVMRHNSIIVFSTHTNKQYVHKIVQEQPSNTEWFGMTWRKSKTALKLLATQNRVVFADTHEPIMYATITDEKSFFKCRSSENSKVDVVWPTFNFTLSPSDWLPPQSSVAPQTVSCLQT